MSKDINVSFKVDNGSTQNINGTKPGTTSDWKALNDKANVNVQGGDITNTVTFTAEKGYQYTIVVSGGGLAKLQKGDQ